MAHHSKFLSVNLNKSYGKSSSTSSSSSIAGYGNGRPHSAGGGGGMVVLSRPRSSSGTTAHKPAPRLAVPPPMNLPSLRKEHERLNPASSKPSSGHGASGLGPGHNSSMSWTKPIPPMPDFRDKDGGARALSTGEQRSFSSCSRPQGFAEKAVILRGEDFPSLLATSAFSSKQKQKQVSENSDGCAEKAELSSVIDMRPKLRSSPLTRSNVQGSEGGSSRVLGSSEQSRQADGNFPVPLPLVRLRHTSDWDDDERDRNHGISGIYHYDGRVLHGGEAPSSLSRDSGRGEPYGKDLMASKKEDRNCNSWRVMVESNKEFSASRVLPVDKDHFGPRNLGVSRGIGKESSHDRFSYGNRKEFGSGLGSGNARVTQAPNDRVEVSNNWQRGRTFTNGMVSKGSMSPRIKGFSTNDHVQNLTKEKLISNVGRSYAEDASWGGKDTLSSDAMLDLKAKLFRKKKDSMKHTDLFDPARESFEAELERVQRLQELERQQVMEEQAREMEVARREAEERERIAREEEERRRLLEEEVREAAWRAEQEKLEATRRAEEQRISREEEKRRIIMEEERRKEAARQKLLELEARIARRQSEANANDRIKESDSSRDSDLAEWEKTERITDHITSSPSFDSSSMNKLFEAGFKPHTLSVENYKTENNWSNNNNSIIKFQEQDSSYPTARQDAFGSNRRFHRKQFQGIHGLKPPSFKRGMSDDQAQTGQSWDRNGDCDQFNGRSNIDAIFGGWDHGHFDGSQLVSYSDRSFQNNEVDDLASCSRVRHTIRQPRVPPPPFFSSSMRKSPFGDASVGPNSSFSVDSDARGNQMGRKEESDLQIVYGCSYHQRIIEPGVEPRTPELLEVPACSLLQTEEKSSPRYDSQSSHSVSNPPSSPTQLSHDEFDDCGGSPAPTTSAEEENMTFSVGKPMIPDSDVGKTDTEMMPFSNAEDAGWAVEDNEEMQEVEDNEEGPDSNQEDNEAHESDTWELHMKNKFEDLDVVVEKPKVVGHAAYGIDDCVQLGASGHYSFNKDSEYGEKMSTNDELVSDSTAEHIFADSSAGSLQSKETIPDKIMIATSEISVETVKEHEDMIFGPVTTEDHPTDGIRVSKNSGQNPIAAVSRLSLPSTSSLCSISASVPMSSGQDDLPAKLQFGLFSSPPLIPSPLPTIQIGSIQTPLPLNAQINSYTQMHPSQPPLFQFGQIRHTPHSSQSVLSIATQTMSYMHHPPLAHHPLNLNPGSSSKNQVSQAFTSTKVFDKGQSSFSADKQSVCAPEITIPCQSNLDSEQPTALFDVPRDEANFAASDEKKDVHNLISHSGNCATTSNNNFRSNVHSKRGRPHVDSLYSVRKPLTGQRTHETMSESRGRRFTYNIRNTDSLSSLIRTESSRVNSNRPQRRVRRNLQGIEYRVKESDGARQMQCTESFDFRGHSGRPNSGNSLEGVPLRNVGRKSPVISKSTKLTHEEAALSGFPVMGVISNMNRDNKKETLQTSMAASGILGDEGNLDKNGFLEGDIDTPLRSGIVRVFNQPGIEASSDGDGFVEVRSKRKMSNERRGQRERETNSKHKAGRLPHSHHATLSSNGISYKSDMITTLAGGAAAKSIHSDPVIAHRRPSSDLEISKLPTTSTAGQAMPPIGGPAVNSTCYDAKFNSVNRAGSDLSIANDRAKVVPSLSFGNNIVVLDKAPVPLGSWDTVHLHNQAVSSTQFRLDEATNPVQCNPVAVAIVSPDDSKHVTSIMTKEKPPFSSENLPNFPFDGEKIQFGAVESSPPLPPSSQSVPSGIWLPGSVILNASIIHNLPMNDHRESSFFDKEKCTSESCTQLDDTEAEAEAAASAVAVAAITNDEITVSTLGTGSISGIGTKGLSGLGVTNCTDATSHLASEESLVVTLPADLSVDTPRTLWPPLPSLQSSRSMLSHITGPQPSPFPFFDPNPMLGGPIFAFRPQDESTGAQPQQQQSAAFVSGPTGTWPQCHSGVDSFYGSPAGFPSPFMSPPAGLSGVHGQPPMVFYNHFAPVGQFGQVGLSYMGSPYLPTGKQPDWTHSSECTSTINVSKADPCNLNVYGQQSTAHVPTPVQHLSTGSSVMQVTSPFTLFNLRPFKSSTEIPVPGQWPSIPHPSSNSIRLSTAPEQLQRLPSDVVSGAKVSLHEPHSTAADLPDELGLVESAACISLNVQTTQASRNHATNSKKDPNGIPNSASSEVGLENMPTPKPQTFQQTTSPVQQHLGPIGKPELPRGSGRDWGRRNTFQGKHRNNSSNKNIGSSKAKQVYVAKSLLTSPATSSLS